MKVKPLKRRIIVFTVPVKRKRGILYVGNARRGTYSSCQEAWIAETSGHEHYDFKQGQRVYVADSFEFEETDLDLWQHYETKPEFDDLRKFRDEVEGDVCTSVIIEASVIAVEE